MTNQEFNDNWRIATGFNTMTVEWIKSLTPETLSGKIYLFTRLIGKVPMLYTIFNSDGTVMKYGRFQHHIHEDKCEISIAGYIFEGYASDLVIKLMEIIFGETEETNFLLSDDSEILIFNDGTKIRIS